MKRIFALTLCLLILCGCAAPSEPTLPIPETTEATSPPNLVVSGRGWDAEGALTEVPLTIPEAWKYTSSRVFGELVLLYGFDAHLMDTTRLDLLLVDPLTGLILAENNLKVYKDTTAEMGRFSIWIDKFTRIYQPYRQRNMKVQKWHEVEFSYSGIPVYFG